jgi:hypothetical protein
VLMRHLRTSSPIIAQSAQQLTRLAVSGLQNDGTRFLGAPSRGA